MYIIIVINNLLKKTVVMVECDYCFLNAVFQHLHGSSRSLVRRIGNSLPIDTGRRLQIQVGVPV